MIISFFFLMIVGLLKFILMPFPVVDELPFGVDETLVSGVSAYKLLAEYIPPLDLMLTLTIIYIGFRLLLLILKFFLGSRTPASHV